MIIIIIILLLSLMNWMLDCLLQGTLHTLVRAT